MKRSLLAKIIAVVAVGLSRPAEAVVPQYKIDAPTINEAFGYAVVSLGDIDGDQADDLLVASPQDNTAAQSAGAVRVISGRDRHVIRRHLGEIENQSFGATLQALGDVNRDGVTDYAIASQRTPGLPLRFTRWCVEVYSGRDGAMLYRRIGSQPFSLFGFSLARLDDVNGDQAPDLAVGEPSGGSSSDGAVYVLSGVDGVTITTILPEPLSSGFGAQLERTSDVNHDGYAELLISAPHTSLLFVPGIGGVFLHSGRDFRPLARRLGSAAEMKFGSPMAALGDVNGDSIPDVAVSGAIIESNVLRERFVRLLSGSDLSDIAEIRQPEVTFGFEMQLLSDIDGDGVLEFAVSTPFLEQNGQLYAGKVRVYSGRDRSVVAEYQHFEPETAGYFGESVAFADIDADGSKELIAGLISEQTTGYLAAYSLVSPQLTPLAVRLHAEVTRKGRFSLRLDSNRAPSQCELSVVMATNRSELFRPIAPLLTLMTDDTTVKLTIRSKLPRVKGQKRHLYSMVRFSCANGEQGVSAVAKIDLSKNRARGKKRTIEQILAIIAAKIGRAVC